MFFKSHVVLLIYYFYLDIQLKPYRTEEIVHRLFYESARFSAFNNQWVVKAKISQRDPTQSSDRDMIYQVSNFKQKIILTKLNRIFSILQFSSLSYFLK